MANHRGHVVCALLLASSGLAEARQVNWTPRQKAPPSPTVASVQPVVAPFRPWLSGSSVAVDAVSGEVYVAEGDGGALVISDAAASSVLRTVPLGGAPEQVVVGPDRRAWVTLRESGEVALIQPGSTTAKKVVVGAEPFGLALSDTSHTLFVSLAGSSEVLALDDATLLPKARYRVPGNPRGVALSPDGMRLFVAHLTGRDVSTIHLDARPGHEVGFIPLVPETDSRGERQPNLTFALATSPTGRDLYVPHVMTQTSVRRGRQSNGYGGAASGSVPLLSALGVIDTGGEILMRRWKSSGTAIRGSLPEPADRYSQPRAIAVDPVRTRVFIAGLGADRVTCFGTGTLSPVELGQVVLGDRVGPRGMALSADGTRLYVYGMLHHRLLVADVSNPNFVGANARPPVLARLVVGDEKLPPAAAHGRALFYSAGNLGVSSEGQLACASCHPEGRADGMVWQVEEGPRRTPILADRLAGTAPYNWLGSHPTLADHIKHTMRERLGGRGMPDHDVADLVTWLTGYCHLAPRPLQPTLTALQQRGKTLFESDDVGCADCHPADQGFRDGQSHDIGTVTRIERAKRIDRALRDAGAIPLSVRVEPATAGSSATAIVTLALSPHSDSAVEMRRAVARAQEQVSEASGGPARYDTPSLVGVSFAGPWFHDGRAESLYAVLTTGNPANRMGHTSHLSAQDLLALVEYLKTL